MILISDSAVNLVSRVRVSGPPRKLVRDGKGVVSKTKSLEKGWNGRRAGECCV